MVHSTIKLALSALIAVALNNHSMAATFETQQSVKHGDWTTSLFKNLNGNRLFCAAETSDGNTVFRINRYKDTSDTFLELYNADWTMMEGNVKFSIDFDVKNENYKAEIAGKSWGDSYTHDFTDVKNYELILGLLSTSKSFNVQNSNGSVIGRFSGSGSLEALQAYNACLN